MRLTILILLLSSLAQAQDLSRGDLSAAIASSKAELMTIATNDPDAFDLDNLEEQGVYSYMCLVDAEYSTELTTICNKLKRAHRE